MATNITGVTMPRPTVDPEIAAGGNFQMGGQISVAGGGGWAESGDMYFEWDQGIGSWVTIGGSGDLYTEDTNPILGLQTATEQIITAKNDGTTGSFQVRVKLIEDDLTEWTTAAVDVVIAGATTYYQAAGQGTISPVASLPRQTYKTMGGYAVAPVGSLGTASIFLMSTGGGTISPTGTLGSVVTFVCAVGEYALSIAGSLAKQTYKSMGGHAMSIIGSLARQTHKTVGSYSVVITGGLATATIFLQGVGGYVVTIVGSLAKKIYIFIGKGAVSPTGSIVKKTSVFIGKASTSITGTLSSISTFGQSAGGGSVSPTGTLGTIAIYVCAVGGSVMSIAGNLIKKTSIFTGNASMIITGALSTVSTVIVESGPTLLKKLIHLRFRSGRGRYSRRR